MCSIISFGDWGSLPKSLLFPGEQGKEDGRGSWGKYLWGKHGAGGHSCISLPTSHLTGLVLMAYLPIKEAGKCGLTMCPGEYNSQSLYLTNIHFTLFPTQRAYSSLPKWAHRRLHPVTERLCFDWTNNLVWTQKEGNGILRNTKDQGALLIYPFLMLSFPVLANHLHKMMS